MVADYTVRGESFVPDRPREWSPTSIRTTGFPPLDLAPDGRRFVVMLIASGESAGDKSTVHVTVMLDFFDELKRRLP